MTTTRSAGLWAKIAFMVGFAVLIALTAQVAIPFYPVPVTLQTLAVLLAGAVLGKRWGTAAVVLYLVAAAAGLPVLANGAGGLRAAMGGTAGYLIGFPAAAYITGWAAAEGWMDRVWPGLTVALVVHAVILTLGTVWLMLSVGLDPARAFQVGAQPFLIGAVVKSGLVVATLWLWRRFRPAAWSDRV